MWGQLGVAGAMKHRPEALEWFARAGDRLSDRQLNWKMRAPCPARWAAVLALHRGDVRQEKQLPVWRYWRARALRPGAARKAMRCSPPCPSSTASTASSRWKSWHQYRLRQDTYRPSAEEVAAMERQPGIQRALKFFQLGLALRGRAGVALDYARLRRQGADRGRGSGRTYGLVRALHRHGGAHADCTTSPCASRRRTVKWCAATVSSSIWTRPGCTAWCARKADFRPMRARARGRWA